MPERIKVGDKLPFFRYDTPYSSQNRSRVLLAAHPPLVLVFMSNLGHPITRAFADRYAQTFKTLSGGSFALVVRSRPDRLARSIRPDTLPYPLLCDADGVLYDFLQIPQRSGALMTYSLEGWQILREARRQGYRPPKNAMQQLPLTLILDREGQVLFCHYGSSLTDVPADCAAMQQLLEALDLANEPAPAAAAVPAPKPVPEESSPSAAAPAAPAPSVSAPKENRIRRGRRRITATADTRPLPLLDGVPAVPRQADPPVQPEERPERAHRRSRPVAAAGSGRPQRRPARGHRGGAEEDTRPLPLLDDTMFELPPELATVYSDDTGDFSPPPAFIAPPAYIPEQQPAPPPAPPEPPRRRSQRHRPATRRYAPPSNKLDDVRMTVARYDDDSVEPLEATGVIGLFDDPYDE